VAGALGLEGLLIAWLVGGLLMLVGGTIVLAVLLTVWKGHRTRSWTTTFGRVLSSGVEETEPVSEEERPSSLGLYQPKVVYEYEADGKRLTTDAIQVRGNVRTTTTIRHEQGLLGRYPAGESVTVYYNPDKPEEAVLEPGVPRGLFPITVVGAGLFLVGLVLILTFTGLLKFPPDLSAEGLFFFVPGLALTLFGLQSLSTVAARRWPTAEGEVIHSTVVRASDHLFQPSVAYRYEVDGVEHTSTAIDWGRFDLSQAEAQRLADQYPVGKPVTVSYDARNPHRAVIEPRGGWMYGVVLLLGVVFAVAGIILIVGRGGV
jgi:hypothetical protein